MSSGPTPAPVPGPAASGRAASSRSWRNSCRSDHPHLSWVCLKVTNNVSASVRGRRYEVIKRLNLTL